MGVVLLAGAGVYFFDWNLVKGYVAEKVSEATGRSFAIRGDLRVDLSAQPRIRAEGLVLGNATWSREPKMVEIGQLDARIDLWQLLQGRVVLSELVFSRPQLLLEKNAEGEANWEVGDKSEAPAALPPIGVLQISDGEFAYRDPKTRTDITMRVATAEPKPGEKEQMMEVSGGGRFKGMPFALRGRVGSVLSLREAENPYPIRVDASIGGTKALVQGTLTDPFELKGLDIDLVLQGQDLAKLYPIVGVPIPPTPPYRLAGHLLHEGHTWTFRRFKGAVGGSDMAGNFSVVGGKDRQLIHADLWSGNLDFKDLAGFIGASTTGRAAQEHAAKAGRVLPDEPYSLEKLRAADAVVRFRGRHVVTERLPIEDMQADLRLDNGKLRLDPLNFGVAGGNIVSRITLDASGDVISTDADVTVRKLRLDKLFPGVKLTQASVGAVGGRARLAMRGNSLARMLGSANGETALIMSGGTISELLVRLANLDIANAAGLWFAGDKNVPIRCLVADFAATDGDMRARTVVLDTDPAKVTATGTIDFKDEMLDLRLAAQAKDRSLASLRGPILIRGPFGKPSIGPDAKDVAARGGLALGLGVLATPLAAFVPLIELGGAQDSDCPALIASAETNVASRPKALAFSPPLPRR